MPRIVGDVEEAVIPEGHPESSLRAHGWGLAACGWLVAAAGWRVAALGGLHRLLEQVLAGAAARRGKTGIFRLLLGKLYRALISNFPHF